jgi:hypothetical protein
LSMSPWMDGFQACTLASKTEPHTAKAAKHIPLPSVGCPNNSI